MRGLESMTLEKFQALIFGLKVVLALLLAGGVYLGIEHGSWYPLIGLVVGIVAGKLLAAVLPHGSFDDDPAT